MRTIKFRVWVFESDIKEGYMLDIYERFDKDCNSDYYLVYEDFRDLEDGRSKHCIPLQFTGLHDKNGKEIYEGYIFKSILNSLENELINPKLVYEELRWVLKDSSKNRNFEYLDYYEADTELEVIGNIYENPELL